MFHSDSQLLISNLLLLSLSLSFLSVVICCEKNDFEMYVRWRKSGQRIEENNSSKFSRRHSVFRNSIYIQIT